MTNNKLEDEQAVTASRVLALLHKKGVVITVKRAADILGVTPQAVNHMLTDKRITNLSIGRAHFVLSSEIEEYRNAKETIREIGGRHD